MPLENHTKPIKAAPLGGVNEYTARKQQTREQGGTTRTAAARPGQSNVQSNVKPVNPQGNNNANSGVKSPIPAPSRARFSLDASFDLPSENGHPISGSTPHIYKQTSNSQWQPPSQPQAQPQAQPDSQSNLQQPATSKRQPSTVPSGGGRNTTIQIPLQASQRQTMQSEAFRQQNAQISRNFSEQQSTGMSEEEKRAWKESIAAIIEPTNEEETNAYLAEEAREYYARKAQREQQPRMPRPEPQQSAFDVTDSLNSIMDDSVNDVGQQQIHSQSRNIRHFHPSRSQQSSVQPDRMPVNQQRKSSVQPEIVGERSQGQTGSQQYQVHPSSTQPNRPVQQLSTMPTQQYPSRQPAGQEMGSSQIQQSKLSMQQRPTGHQASTQAKVNPTQQPAKPPLQALHTMQQAGSALSNQTQQPTPHHRTEHSPVGQSRNCETLQPARQMRVSSIPQTPTRTAPALADQRTPTARQPTNKAVVFRSTPEYIEPGQQSPAFSSAAIAREQSPIRQPPRPASANAHLPSTPSRQYSSVTPRITAATDRATSNSLQQKLANANRFAPQQPSRLAQAQSIQNMQNSSPSQYMMVDQDTRMPDVQSYGINFGQNQSDANVERHSLYQQLSHTQGHPNYTAQGPTCQQLSSQDSQTQYVQELAVLSGNQYSDMDIDDHYILTSQPSHVSPSRPRSTPPFGHDLNHNSRAASSFQYHQQRTDTVVDPRYDQNVFARSNNEASLPQAQSTLHMHTQDMAHASNQSMPPPPVPHHRVQRSLYAEPDQQYRDDVNASKKRRMGPRQSAPNRRLNRNVLKQPENIPGTEIPKPSQLDYDMEELKTMKLKDLQREPFLRDPRGQNTDAKQKGMELSLEELFGEMWRTEPDKVRKIVQEQNERDWQKTEVWLKEKQKEDLERLMAVRLERRKLVMKHQDVLRRRNHMIELHRSKVREEVNELKIGASALLSGRWRPTRDGLDPHNAPPAEPEKQKETEKPAKAKKRRKKSNKKHSDLSGESSKRAESNGHQEQVQK